MEDRRSPATPESERTLLEEVVRRQRVLSEISRLLLDYTEGDEVAALDRIVGRVVEGLGDWCAFSLVQPDGLLKQVAAYHPDERQRVLAERLTTLQPPRRWDAGPAETNALLQRRPLVFEQITDEFLRLGAASPEVYALLREIGLTSCIVAPLLVKEEPLGTLVLASAGPGGRRYSAHDVDFVSSLASRAALAIRNARLVRALDAARAEAERRAAELLAVFESDPNGVAVFGPDDRLRYASHTMDEQLGFPFSQRAGAHYRELFDDPRMPEVVGDRAEQRERFDEVFKDRGATATLLVELERPRRFLARTTTPVLGADGAYLGRLFVSVDVTREHELTRQRADFVTVAAHELRTPLTPLTMYLQTMERRLARGEPLPKDLPGKAQRQVVRLTKLVQDLLDVARADEGRFDLRRSPVLLEELAAEVVADFRASARQHEIVLRGPAEPLRIEGDRERLEQVLVNLIGNAMKYSPGGGRVVVTLGKRGGEACVSVCDEGIGIPSEEHQHLFERFFRARNADTTNFGGLGIGLFVSHQIVQRHGGRFEVESEHGHGATFRFFLPLAEGKPARAEGRRRVLVVDDDPDILEATTRVLEEDGYSVSQARDGLAALEQLRKEPPDLMLVDLMMPVLDGWSLIGRVQDQKLAPGVPLVVFSADRDARRHAQELGAAAALRKPFTLEELLELVARLVPRQAPAA